MAGVGYSSVATGRWRNDYATYPRSRGLPIKGRPETDLPPEQAHNVTFKARAGAKPVSTLANGAFAGLRLHGKGANRTPPTRCPYLLGLPQPGRPAAQGLRSGLQPRADE